MGWRDNVCQMLLPGGARGAMGGKVCGLAASYLLIYANNHVRKRLVER